MDASSLPPELFACVIKFLPPTVALKLERVCKTWNTFLKNQQLWKELGSFTNLSRDFDQTDDYKTMLLRYTFAIMNMKDKKCIVRSIASAINTPRGTILHKLSTCGREVLLSLVDNQQFSSSERNFHMGHQFLDLNAWEHTKLEFEDSHKNEQIDNALLTKNHILTFPASYFFNDQILISSSIKNRPLLSNDGINYLNFQVFLREDMQMGTITINDTVAGFYTVTSNLDPTFETICLHNIHMGSIIVDLHDDYKIHRMPAGEIQQKEKVCLCGHYLVQSNSDPSVLTMEIIDVRSKSVIYTETTDKYCSWAVSDNRLLMFCQTADGNTRWVLKDFEGKIIHEYTSNRWDHSKPAFNASAAAVIHGDIIGIFHGNYQVLFYNAVTATNICVLELDDYFVLSPSSRYHVKFLAVGVGKFILSCGSDSRLIDFEARALSLRPKTFTLVSTSGQVRNIPTNFHNILGKAETALGLKRYCLASVCVKATANERISMILQAKKDQNHQSGEENAVGAKLLKKASPLLIFAVNMLGYGFLSSDEVTPATVKQQQNTMKDDWSLHWGEVRGDILLVCEQLVQFNSSHSEWMPTSPISAEELEALTNGDS